MGGGNRIDQHLLGSSVEGNRLMESGEEWFKEMVYCHIDTQYVGDFGNCLYFLFFKEKER